NDDTPGCIVGDGASVPHGSRVTIPVTAGQVYFIVVDGFSGSGGSFTLTVTPPSTCGNNTVEGTEECDGTDVTPCATGHGSATCECVPPPGGLPDLVSGISDVVIEFGATVGAGDVAEGCASRTDNVDLLRFTQTTRNIGTADLVLGDPQCPPCSTN